MRQVVNAQFGDVLKLSRDMVKFVERTCPWGKPVNLNTSLNNDLELAGLGWDNFLAAYEKEFSRQKLEGLHYDNFFYEVGIDYKYIFDKILRLIRFGEQISFRRSRKPHLTVEDLVASELAGKFVRRVDVIIKR